jgi:FAD:protein FMN transferase
MKLRISVAIALCAVILLAGCGGQLAKKNPRNFDSKRKTSFEHFGTVCFAAVYDDFNDSSAMPRFDSAWQEISAMLTELENSVSVDIPESDISRFNRARSGESVKVNPVTAAIVAESIKMYEFTGGAFNPAVANLVDLWGFSPRFRKNSSTKMPYDRAQHEDGSFDLPDPRYVAAFKILCDFSLVKLSGDKNNGFYLSKAAKDIVLDGATYSLKIDLGGIAKGYAAEEAAAILKKHGYEYGYVNLGLSSMKMLKRNVSDTGAPSNNMWAISISNPADKTKEYLSIFGKDIGVSTSGTYDVHYFFGGREYSHIIDANTGEPTTSDIASVTILGADAGYDDAISTALCVMGKDKAIEFMKTHLKEYLVALMIRNGEGIELVTNIPKNEYALVDSMR